jgi:glycosyltransferase involved in cell wall biosynthesis
MVSTFNAEDFIEGCLQDLVNQTIFAEGRMEILIIDSGSEQQECKIVEEFQKAHQSIIYFRTDERESLYKSWNRAIEKARGEYLTNANTDDRHDPKCIELLSRALDKNPACGLSYGNLYKTFVPNADYDTEENSQTCHSQEFFPGSVMLHYIYGAQPMWRKSLHAEVGIFNENFKALGDYDFALRLISKGITSKYVSDAWGKMLWHNEALSTRDFTALQEKRSIIEQHRNAETVFASYQPILSTEQAHREREEILDECFLDLGLRALCHYPQFSKQEPHIDLDMLDFAFSRKTEDKRFTNNRLLLDLLLGKRRKPLDKLKRNAIAQGNLRFLEVGIGSGEFYFWGSTFGFPTENKLKDIQSHYLSPKKEKTTGEDRNMYVFSFDKFWCQMLKNIPVKELPNYENIYVWGANDRAILLSSWLKSHNISFSLVDSNPESQEDTKNGMPVIGPDVLFTEAKGNRVAVILAMGSHYHSTLASRLKDKLDQVDIFPM